MIKPVSQMPSSIKKSYTCKDEELPIIVKYIVYNLRRDLNDFATFSPKFNRAYCNYLDVKIAEAMTVIEPKTETATLKLVNDQMDNVINELLNDINYLSGYLTLAQASIKLSATDFGLTIVRKSAQQTQY